MDRPTFDALYAAAVAAINGARFITGDTRPIDFTPGTQAAMLVVADAMLADQVTAYAVSKFRDSFVATARGDALDIRITDDGGPERNPASAATVTLTLVRGSYVGSYSLPLGTEVSGYRPDGTRVTFTTSAATLGGAAPSVDVTAECSSTGIDGNVPADTLTSCPTLPSGLSFEQPDRAAGGADVETNDAYRSRYKLWVASLQGAGTPEWIEAMALDVDGVTQVTVDDISFRAPADGGYVAIYIGDPDAESSAPLIAAVQAVFDAANGHVAGLEYVVFGCEREELTFTIDAKVTAGSGITEDQLKQNLIDYLNSAGIARTVYLSAAEAYAHAQIGPNLLSIDIAHSGAHEVTPTQPYMAIRTADDGSQLTVDITEV